MAIEKNYALVIKGFKTKNQLMEFVHWYEDQGEQDSSIWFEEAKSLGKIGVKSMSVDLKKPHIDTGEEVTIWVDPK